MSLKKKWTRLISGFLAVVMVVGLFPTFTIPATAADMPEKSIWPTPDMMGIT